MRRALLLLLSVLALLGVPALHAQTLTANLAWDQASGTDPVVGFKLYRQTGCAGSYVQVNGTLPATPLSYSDTGLTPTGSYCWYVTAIGASTTESAASNILRWDEAATAPSFAVVADAPPWVPVGLLNTSAPVQRHHPLLRGLQGWWRVTAPLDGSPRLWDLAGREHWGALLNMVPPTTGWRPTTRPGGEGEIRFGGTVAQGGNSEYITFGTRIGVTSSFTALLWIKGLQHQDVNIFGQDSAATDMWGLNWQPADHKLYCFVGPYNVAAATSLTTFEPTDWAHIACTYDGTTIRLYINALPQNATTYTGGFVGGTPLMLGALGLPQYAMEGSVDDAMLYDRALAQAEIGMLMSLSSQGWPDVLQRVGPLPQQLLVQGVTGGAKRGFLQIME